MLALYRLVLALHLACCVEAYHYYIHNQTATWSEAVKSCQQNGSVLAVLDTQAKLEELAAKLRLLGYTKTDKFWIGLVFNASSQQFQWGTGVSARESFVNSACGLNPNGQSFQGNNLCYLLKHAVHHHTNFSLPCFERRACDQGHVYRYICQAENFNETNTLSPSALATRLNTLTHNTVIHTTNAASATPITTSSIVPEGGTDTISSKFISSSSTLLRSEGSTVLEVTPDTKGEINSENSVLELSSLINSLNPQDPLSLKAATDAFEVFATSVQTRNKSRIDINLMESTQTIEEFAFKYASFNLNASHTEERRENKHIALQVSLLPKGHSLNFTFTEEDDTGELARITLPSFLFHNQDTLVVNILYRDLHELADNLESRKRKIDSMILGSDVQPSKQEAFTENVTIVLRTLEENDNRRRKDCVFWKWNSSHPANGSWSGDGCSLVESNSSHVVCTCNHLTNFAILMNIKQQKIPDEHRRALCYITYIGLGISLLGEAITIFAYILLLCSSNDQPSHVHINLVATLAMAQIIFLAGIDATHNQVLCVTVAALIHYFYLSSFCWMLIEGVMLYMFIIEVYNPELKLPLCYGFSLGFPGLVVGCVLTFAHLRSEGIHQYTAETWCWLSTEKYYIWSFAGPVIMITAVNVVVFCIVVKEMVNMSSMQSSKVTRVKATVKACVVLFPLLGITWLFGLLSMTSTSVVPQYIFTVLNSIQGLLIFVFHCLRNTEIRVAWNKKLKRFKKQAWHLFKVGSPPQTSTSENNSNKQGPSEVELNRRSNKIAPVEG